MFDWISQAYQAVEHGFHSIELWLQAQPGTVDVNGFPIPGAEAHHAPLLPANVTAARLGIAFAFGCVAAAIHYFTSASRFKRDRSIPALAATLVLLSVLIALVMMVIGSSLARAFGLAGALAIVRFRTVVEDTRDTAFVMFAVIAGMAAGVGYLIGPLVCTPVVLLAAWLFRTRRPPEHGRHGSLVLRLAAGRTPDERIEAALSEHLPGYRLTGLSTARGGAALDAVYAVQLPAAGRVFGVVGELTKLEGVQGVELKED